MRPIFGLAAVCVGAILTSNAMLSYLPLYLNLTGIVIAIFLITKFAGNDFNFQSVSAVVAGALVLELLVLTTFSQLLEPSLAIFTLTRYTLALICSLILLCSTLSKIVVLLC